MANDIGYDSMPGLPNKLVQRDGSITDLVGNPVSNPSIGYENMRALPNKFLNPNGTYSTLNEILASMIDTELFIVVEELPSSGEANKIYLLIDGEKLIEYIWINNKWDPVGMVEVDISKYSTTEEMNAAITSALNSAKSYADSLVGNFKDYTIYHWDGKPSATTASNIALFQQIVNDHLAGKHVLIVRSADSDSEIPGSYYPVIFVFDTSVTPWVASNFTAYILDGTNFMNVAVGTGESYIHYINVRLLVDLDKSNTNTVTGVRVSEGEVSSPFLDTNQNYPTPYVPQYDGSPATKKYVDDAITDRIGDALGGDY